MFDRRGGKLSILLSLCALAAALTVPARAGIKVFEEGDRFVEIGARVQIQYLQTDFEGSETRDQVFFRRLRPYISGSVTKNWVGKVQFDFGKTIDGNEVAIKDAYMQYKGWKNKTLTIGNAKTPFSREFMTSSNRQQTVERGFVGDHNFGTPDRQLGFRLDGQNAGKKVTYSLALGGEHHDPSATRMDFDSPANNNTDWNEGLVIAGRVDFHPMGFVKFDQGDFNSSGVKPNFSLAFFSWSNDDDNNTYTDPATGLSTSGSKADLDSAEGFELSAGIRGNGISVDVEYNLISADTVDPIFTGGVYRSGSTDLDKFHVEGGFMLPSNQIELVGSWESLDADNYLDTWTATEVGVNYFWNKHKVKAQLTYRMGENRLGVPGADGDTTLLQWQFVF